MNKTKTQKNKVLDTEKVKAQTELQIKDHTEAAKMLRNYQSKHDEVSREIEKQQADITKLITKTDEIIGKGGSIDSVNEQIREIKTAKAQSDELLQRLTDKLIPTAKKQLQDANRRLEAATLTALSLQRQAGELKMSSLLKEAMDLSDSWQDECDVLFRELGLRVNAGGMDIILRATEERLGRYVENGCLRQKNTSVPQTKPAADDKKNEAAEKEPSQVGANKEVTA